MLSAVHDAGWFFSDLETRFVGKRVAVSWSGKTTSLNKKGNNEGNLLDMPHDAVKECWFHFSRRDRIHGPQNH